MDALSTLNQVSHDFILTVLHQVRNALPVPLVVIGGKMGVIDLDSTLMILGILYVLVQIGYLVWKWRSEWKKLKEIKSRVQDWKTENPKECSTSRKP